MADDSPLASSFRVTYRAGVPSQPIKITQGAWQDLAMTGGDRAGLLTPLVDIPRLSRDDVFRAYKPPPMPATKPGDGLAMDAAIKIAQDWNDNSLAFAQVGGSALSQGIGFLGYPFLAELTQRPEYRKISETVAEEMTRRWIRLTNNGDDDLTDKLTDLEAACERLHLRDRFKAMAELDGFFGRAQLYPDIKGARDNPEELKKPLLLKDAKVGKGDLLGFNVVEPMWSYALQYNSVDPLRDDFYKPQAWAVMSREVHSSRLLTFVGRPMPDILKAAYAFGGLSLSQMAIPYVQNWLRTRQSVSDLIHSFSIMILLTDMGQTLDSQGMADLVRRISVAVQMRDNRGMQVADKEKEDIKNVSAPLGSLDKLQAQSLEQICVVASQPLVKYTGITPSGLNASSDGEIRVFYDKIKATQEYFFGPNLKNALDLIQLSEFGEIDEDIGYEFIGLWELDEAAKAAVVKTQVDTDVEAINAGIIDPAEARKRLATAPETPYVGLDVDAVPDDPRDPETFPDPNAGSGGGENPPRLLPNPARTAEPKKVEASGDSDKEVRSLLKRAVAVLALDEFNEADHPRDPDGKFASGGGGGGGGGEATGGAQNDFDAYAYAQSQDDPSATAETIMAKLSPEQRTEVEQLHTKIAARGQTIERHRDAEGRYNATRAAAHEMMLFEGREGLDPDNPGGRKFYEGILSPERVAAARPPAGEKPTFTILGGRGGSGKSQLRGEAYSDDNAIVLDADVIKHMIEEFEGWNANEVHEESSDVLETALRIARREGLNVVLDATMKSAGGALEKVNAFKEAGYRVEAHYMHLPRHIAAQRAVERYFSPSKKSPELRGRYVPAHVVLGNRLNEQSFNEVRKHADRWSFRDNNVPRGEKARLIAQGGY